MLTKIITSLFLERPAKKLTMSAWGEKLTASGEAIGQKLDKIPDSQSNRQMLSHIIGIEQWGQSRLRVGLGEPFKEEEYDGYRPSQNRSWEQLKTEFRIVRRKTVALAEELDNKQADQFMTVKHNQFGEISLGAWLRYLDFHTSRESKRIK
ncbi:DinB family protein [Candidatus Leptofilum sp.]|uniref:DinB family protein n=1 Tax=Candidatus Leptofilum sp. TaxID=3241576 RepID=UPI003B5A61D3